jgi:TolA-binding protein
LRSQLKNATLVRRGECGKGRKSLEQNDVGGIKRCAMTIKTCGILFAIFFLLQSFAADAQDKTNLYDSGVDKVSKGDFYGAINDFTKVIEQVPMEPKPYYYRGISKYNLRDYNGALSDFTKAIEFNPKYADAFYMRGMSKVGMKKKKDACEDFTLAAKYGNANASYALDKYCN